MKITKSRLKQIIKESMQDEYKERLREMFMNGETEQAIELARSAGMEDFLVGSTPMADLSGMNLSEINFTDAVLRHSRFENANLSKANMTGVDLRGAVLMEANMTNANLSEANLSYSNLLDADLTGAVLRGVRLYNANLKGAKLEHADLTDILYNKDTQWPEGFEP